MQIKYSCSEYQHICMQHWLCFSFKQGQLYCDPAAGSFCLLHQRIIIRTKVYIGVSCRGSSRKTQYIINQCKSVSASMQGWYRAAWMSDHSHFHTSSSSPLTDLESLLEQSPNSHHICRVSVPEDAFRKVLLYSSRHYVYNYSPSLFLNDVPKYFTSLIFRVKIADLNCMWGNTRKYR